MGSHAQMKVARKWKNQTNHLVANQLEVNQTSQLATSQLGTNQPVISQPVISQPVANQTNHLAKTSHQFSVMMVNGQSAQNQQPLKMVKSSVRRTHVCSNVLRVSWPMDLQRASV